ncbi:hypothetical protein llap_9073 [Limosa lapponica baueri]|uniref:POC1 centriolar protein homolog A n=1 Tax=Limosa lapponica baueri TaxID=1758121 RepID=A0A2I0U3J0_LIMLA|nr:hypothetical protein llap_9073 [Limosa lapponica baueri]
MWEVGPATCVAFSRAGDFFASGGSDEQVMVWKTNFDAADYGDVLKTQKSGTSVDGTHHTPQSEMDCGVHLKKTKPQDSGRNQEQQEEETSLANTLEHIMGQLDVLTQDFNKLSSIYSLVGNGDMCCAPDTTGGSDPATEKGHEHEPGSSESSLTLASSIFLLGLIVGSLSSEKQQQQLAGAE